MHLERYCVHVNKNHAICKMRLTYLKQSKPEYSGTVA